MPRIVLAVLCLCAAVWRLCAAFEDLSRASASLGLTRRTPKAAGHYRRLRARCMLRILLWGLIATVLSALLVFLTLSTIRALM